MLRRSFFFGLPALLLGLWTHRKSRAETERPRLTQLIQRTNQSPVRFRQTGDTKPATLDLQPSSLRHLADLIESGQMIVTPGDRPLTYWMHYRDHPDKKCGVCFRSDGRMTDARYSVTITMVGNWRMVELFLPFDSEDNRAYWPVFARFEGSKLVEWTTEIPTEFS